MGQVAHGVLDHDDRAIDHQTEIKRAEAEQAAGNAEAEHAAEGEEHRQRNGRRHHQHGAEIAQEDEKDSDHQQEALEKIPAHGGDHLVHKIGALVDRLDVDVRRKIFLDLGEFLCETWIESERRKEGLLRHEVGNEGLPSRRAETVDRRRGHGSGTVPPTPDRS